MNRSRTSLLIAALAAAALAGCASGGVTGYTDNAPPDPHLIKLNIGTGGVVVSDQDPLVFPRTERNKKTTIRWMLPKRSAFTFPKDGIVFDHEADSDIIDCHASKDRSEFSCENLHTRPGRYKYTIKVLDGDSGLEPLERLAVNS